MTCVAAKMTRCEDEKVICVDVKTRGCWGDVKMGRCEDDMCRCDDARMMGRCEDERM